MRIRPIRLDDVVQGLRAELSNLISTTAMLQIQLRPQETHSCCIDRRWLRRAPVEFVPNGGFERVNTKLSVPFHESPHCSLAVEARSTKWSPGSDIAVPRPGCAPPVRPLASGDPTLLLHSPGPVPFRLQGQPRRYGRRASLHVNVVGAGHGFARLCTRSGARNRLPRPGVARLKGRPGHSYSVRNRRRQRWTMRIARYM